MFENYIERENTIFDILQAFVDAALDFVVVGGYAVSAYKHRFSVDVDVVIEMHEKTNFEDVLKKEGFVKTIVKVLDHLHAPEFMRYEKKNKLPVSVDLLIGGIGSRTTGASFSFDQLKEHSYDIKIIGTEKEVLVQVPKREVLIVLKLHSGRLTDFRDIASLTKNIDLEIIENLIWRGKIEIVKENIGKLISLLDKKEFMDSFKGVFMEKKYDIDSNEIKKLEKLLKHN
ncbi:MAG: nucleotidyl transferase AbiEii/AbiGii toxin family protein [Nanoarchaeota archaeon]